ncbi:MAG: ribulose-phosphate 3-epimerase [Candidatus Omnitrophota bacterium]|nr:MAG: ribulose-phosphate 3-epimerase [Candidatus Omnitrophota bacterium]
MKIKIAASILSADFSCLNEEIRKVESAGADMLHIDVMDGHFVPNITIGPMVVEDIRKSTALPLDVHLMIEKPQDFIDDFVKAGSNLITVHIETVTERKAREIKERLQKKGVRLGISLNPLTALHTIDKTLAFVDFVLVMSVNPGFGGQEFIGSVVPKIKELRSFFKGDIAVDGGINETTGKQVVAAGASILAAGSYIFKSKDYADSIRRLKCQA